MKMESILLGDQHVIVRGVLDHSYSSYQLKKLETKGSVNPFITKKWKNDSFFSS